MERRSSPAIAANHDHGQHALPMPSNSVAVTSAPSSPPESYTPPEEDSYSATAFSEVMDRSTRAMVARMTLGLSPAALTAVWTDWALHMLGSPGKQMRLVEKAARKAVRFGQYAGRCAMQGGSTPACIEPLPQDPRFRSEAWHKPPFNLYHQAFLLTQQWVHNATSDVRGMTPEHQRAAVFIARQLMDVIAPSNFLLTNPDLQQKTWAEGGFNFVKGLQNFAEDWERKISGKPPVGAEKFRVGEAVAVTPGKVVYRNRLIELIQYAPATKQVRPEPILIVPAWIMKYYILDLSPNNSMIRYLTEQGYTVFTISWRNPGPEDRDLGMEDYRRLGPMEALDAVQQITGCKKVHMVGYCLGGTMATIAASAMARDGDDRLVTLTLLAAQTDFTEPGELALFISEGEVAFLEDLMWEQGFLDSDQMAGAFQLLRSNDLIWSRMLHEYLMGERMPMFDMMAWNADATRMPYRMHSEYLRRLFLNNELASGKYPVDGRPIAITDIRVPIFAVGTETDHVVPWRSGYKIHLLSDTELTFALTSGGHNTGVVSEPGHKGRAYRVQSVKASDPYVDPDRWLASVARQDGSWWTPWTAWLAERSGKPVAPPPMGGDGVALETLPDAPGSYVRMR